MDGLGWPKFRFHFHLFSRYPAKNSPNIRLRLGFARYCLLCIWPRPRIRIQLSGSRPGSNRIINFLPGFGSALPARLPRPGIEPGGWLLGDLSDVFEKIVSCTKFPPFSLLFGRRPSLGNCAATVELCCSSSPPSYSSHHVLPCAPLPFPGTSPEPPRCQWPSLHRRFFARLWRFPLFLAAAPASSFWPHRPLSVLPLPSFCRSHYRRQAVEP